MTRPPASQPPAARRAAAARSAGASVAPPTAPPTPPRAAWLPGRPWDAAWLLTGVAAVIYATLLALGPSHALAVPAVERPMLLVIGLYAAAFVPCWLAWWLAVRMPAGRWLIAWVLGTSVLWRALLLPTPPFQEIDIYRYLWDGRVASQGGDPYRFPPAAVVAAIDLERAGGDVDAAFPPPMRRLVQAATAGSGAYEAIVREVHFGALPSPYPPVSQAVFAASAATSPFDSPTRHLKWLKAWLTAFDVATLGVLVWLLRLTGLHPGHAIAYGWCPLVVKEVAGSGHLDSIATFFAVAAVAATVAGVQSARPGVRWAGCIGGALALALGVGAKLFPVVLATLLVLVWLRRDSWAKGLAAGLVFLAASAVCLAPMLAGGRPPEPDPAARADAAAVAEPAAPAAGPMDETAILPPPPGDELAPPAAGVPPAPQGEKTDGIAAFLTEWEMNDLIFAVVVENLRPQSGVAAARRPWFVITGDETATAITAAWRDAAGAVYPPAMLWSDSRASFLLARVITAAVFVAIAVTLAWRAAGPCKGGGSPAGALALPRAAFLTLAWFWLLAPTQNPWYWCWAAPLLPFARCRAWALLAALALLYYLRFWLLAHRPGPGVMGTAYDGAHFFYFVVAWIEFAPWLALLAGESLWRRRRSAECATLHRR
ncbi:MAG: hypothetical protein AAF790_07575 [Planctomycetota bacterium]